MCHNRNNHYSASSDFSRHDNKFNDGKYYSQKHKHVEKKSRNNVKQDLRKGIYNSY